MSTNLDISGFHLVTWTMIQRAPEALDALLDELGSRSWHTGVDGDKTRQAVRIQMNQALEAYAETYIHGGESDPLEAMMQQLRTCGWSVSRRGTRERLLEDADMRAGLRAYQRVMTRR